MKHDSQQDEHSHDAGESEIEKKVSLNAKLAEEMKKDGINCESLPVGSIPMENKPYYSHSFALTPKFVTNRGCVKIRERNIDFIQIIQRN